jgi:hypothetical protein
VTRLRLVLLDSELLAQVLRGVPLLLLAIWFISPWWDAFNGASAFAHLLQWAPRPAWAALSLTIALWHAYSVYTQAWWLRQAGLMASFLWWALLVVLSFTDGEAWRPAAALVLANAITAFISYVRLGMTPHHGSMAEGAEGVQDGA